jgi:dihydropyrimidine dehydrogenase (NAD+) subunit PreT
MTDSSPAGDRWTVPPDRLETKLPDRKPLLSASEAVAEASRCLYCHDAPCIESCPTTIDIPTFIRRISAGNLRGSARTILESNLLGSSCARVCPVEVLCEGKCVYVGWGRPAIQIGRLQRYAMEKGHRMGGSRGLLAKRPASGRSVGLVGAGPATLACAGRLALSGHRSIVYEKSALPGGLNATGVAPYKLQADEALREIEYIQSLGVEIRTGIEVGRDVSADELLERHDAVFLGLGLGKDSRLGIPGEDGPGVVGAIEWIRRLKIDPSLSVDGVRRAVVVGGGNTAVDVTRELAGLGVGSVTLVYRRRESAMKAYAHELAHARREGVVVVQNGAVTEVMRNGDGSVVGIRLVEADGGLPTDRDRGVIAADIIVIATGQARHRELATQFAGVECSATGCIVVDPESRATGNARVFAGGDAVNGGKEVVNAVDDGQAAAAAIDRLLRKEADHA